MLERLCDTHKNGILEYTAKVFAREILYFLKKYQDVE